MTSDTVVAYQAYRLHENDAEYSPDAGQWVSPTATHWALVYIFALLISALAWLYIPLSKSF